MLANRPEPMAEVPPELRKYLIVAPIQPPVLTKKDPDVFVSKPQLYAELINRVETLERFHIGVLFKANNIRIRGIIEKIDEGEPLENSLEMDPEAQIGRHEEFQLMCDYTAGKVSDDPEVIAKAQKAADRIIETHLALITSFAKHFSESDDDLEEIIHEGILILLDRLDTYVERGLMQVRFCTVLLNPFYDQLGRRAREVKSTVRVPTEAYGRAARYGDTKWLYNAEDIEEPDLEEYALMSGVEPLTFVKAQELIEGGGVAQPIDLDTPAVLPSVEDVMQIRDAVNLAAEKVQRLTRRQQAVVREYYGVQSPGEPFEDTERTFAEIGEASGTSRANVHEIKDKAIAHLRRSFLQREIEDPRFTL